MNSGILQKTTAVLPIVVMLALAGCAGGDGAFVVPDSELEPSVPDDMETQVSEIDEQVSEIDEQMSEIDEQVSEIDEQVSEIDEQVSEIDEQMSEIDEQMSEIDEQMSEIDEQMSEIDEQMSEIDEQMSEIDEQVSEIDEQVSEIDEVLDLSQYLTPATEQGAAPGIISAIIDKDGVRAIGVAGVRRQGSAEKMTVDDLVHIGSDTKAMTSTMLATLVEDGTIAGGWDTTIADVFPELSDSIHQDYHSVTLAQLVRMRGGITPNAANWAAYPDNPDIVERRYNILRDNLSNPPAGIVGDHMYSNLSYMVAGAMAERLTGKSWETLMEERLFAPLGITTAGFGPPGTPGGVDQPWGHVPDGSGGWQPVQGDNDPALGPAGTVHISIEDWAKFISLWFTDNEPAILDRGTLDELSTPESGDYAAGWVVWYRSWAGGTAPWHDGSNVLWYVMLHIAPERGLAYVVAANASDFIEDQGVVDALNSIVAGLVTNEELPGGRGPHTPQDHVVQLAADDGTSVGALRNEDGDLTGLMVGNTAVSVDYHWIGRVSGGSQRPTVGSILQNENVRIRHVHSHWNMAADVVSPFEYLSYGSWAMVAPEVGGDAGFDYGYESVGGVYLVALDSARTSAGDMPVSGTATYLGQYTGLGQSPGVDGAIFRFDGDVEVTAEFDNAEITVDMLSTNNNRLVLSGAIQGNGFSGTTIDQMSGAATVIQAQGATAQFEGGFYGNEAVEAGGVFELVGGRAQNPGRLVGAFGGRNSQ